MYRILNAFVPVQQATAIYITKVFPSLPISLSRALSVFLSLFLALYLQIDVTYNVPDPVAKPAFQLMVQLKEPRQERHTPVSSSWHLSSRSRSSADNRSEQSRSRRAPVEDEDPAGHQDHLDYRLTLEACARYGNAPWFCLMNFKPTITLMASWPQTITLMVFMICYNTYYLIPVPELYFWVDSSHPGSVKLPVL